MTDREKEEFFKALDRHYEACIARGDSIRKMSREQCESMRELLDAVRKHSESMIELPKPAECGGERQRALGEALKSLAHDLLELNLNGERNSEHIRALLRIAEAHDPPPTHPN